MSDSSILSSDLTGIISSSSGNSNVVLPNSINLASDSIQHWVDIIGSVTSLFSFFSAVLIAILGFLTYKNYQLKRQSEEDVKSIIKNKEDSLQLFDKVKEDYDSFSKQLREWNEDIQKSFNESNNWREEIQQIMLETTQILDEMKSGLNNTVKAESQIQQIKEKLDSLVSPSPSPEIPSILKTSALEEALEAQRRIQKTISQSEYIKAIDNWQNNK